MAAWLLQLLSDTALCRRSSGLVAGLITELLGDTTVQGALNARIFIACSTPAGGGALRTWAAGGGRGRRTVSPIPSSPTLWALWSGLC